MISSYVFYTPPGIVLTFSFVLFFSRLYKELSENTDKNEMHNQMICI